MAKHVLSADTTIHTFGGQGLYGKRFAYGYTNNHDKFARVGGWVLILQGLRPYFMNLGKRV